MKHALSYADALAHRTLTPARQADRERYTPPFPDPPLTVCPNCGSEAGVHGDCRRETA